jgi:hypothetical protein
MLNFRVLTVGFRNKFIVYEKFSEINFCYYEKFSEKYNFSERFSPLPCEESRVCYKIVGVSEIILN